jgi:tetratricopeptide (TPR) repeat protein
MKWLFAFAIVVLLAAPGSAQAQRLDDEYVQIFNLIQEADALSSAQPSQALPKYAEAQKGLERLQKSSPDWNPSVVAFRLRYVRAKIAAISPQTPVEPAPQPQAGPASPNPSPEELQFQLNSSKDQIRQLQADKGVLEAKLKEALAMQPAAVDPRELAKAEDKIKALQKENDLLKVTVENEKTKLVAPAAPQGHEASLADVNRQLAKQKELNSQLALEKAALESKVKQLTATTGAGAAALAAGPNEVSRVNQLEKERDSLQKQLQDANKELADRKAKPGSRKVKDLENQVTDLRARLETLEAPKVPYSAEELALLKAPDTQLSTPDKPARTREFPPGSAPLIAQAQNYFAAQQFDKAEATYKQVLQMDQKNVPALANLAAIQVEAKHFDDADNSLKQAMATAPDDPYTLYVLGLLRFRQNRYDDALDALSRSAKLDPQKAEVQNYMGLALSEKGLRGPAETALRKAIELQPNYAGAHYNLALFYATQQPKYPALARWHYQKALNAGFPRNADLEKLLGDGKPAADK